LPGRNDLVHLGNKRQHFLIEHIGFLQHQQMIGSCNLLETGIRPQSMSRLCAFDKEYIRVLSHQ